MKRYASTLFCFIITFLYPLAVATFFFQKSQFHHLHFIASFNVHHEYSSFLFLIKILLPVRAIPDASIGEFTLLRLKAVDLANPAVNIAIKAFESELIKISPQLSSHVSVLFKKTSKLPSINSIINVLKPTKRITLEPLPYRL